MIKFLQKLLQLTFFIAIIIATVFFYEKYGYLYQYFFNMFPKILQPARETNWGLMILLFPIIWLIPFAILTFVAIVVLMIITTIALVSPIFLAITVFAIVSMIIHA